MKTAIATRFRCRCPLSDLFQKTLMFATFGLQYLNKLVEGEVRDFAPPEPFHAIKVQRFNGDGIKPLTEFRRKLPMEILALIRNLTVKPGEVSDTPPPPVRTFLFAAQLFVESAKFVQGMFQRLRVLFLFTRAQGQVSLFHAEVCPNALTCCGRRFRSV